MRHVIVLAALLSATTAVAQDAKRPATQGPAGAHAPASKPAPTTSEAEAEKSRAANEAKEKSRDERMRKAMRGICNGC
jgi:hypothetical protein